MPRGRKDISKDAVKFSKEYQPSGEAKSKGRKRKRLLKDLANALITGAKLEELKELSNRLGLDLDEDEFTLDISLTLKQVEKALESGDTPAFNSAMDRFIGKPTQTMEIEDKRERPIFNDTGFETDSEEDDD